MPRAVAIGGAVWCGAMAAFAEPPSGLPVIPPSSTFPAPSSAPAPVPPAIPPTPPCGPPSPPVETAPVPSITVGTFDAAGATSFRFGDVEVPGSELARRLALEVGLRLGDASGLRLVDASGGFPAEYALNASVETAGLAETVRTIKASGYVYRDGSASLTAIARLVRRSDGLVVWSDRVRSDLGRESLERLAATGGPLPEATVARLVADAGGRIADEAVDRLVPRAIAAVEGGEIRLNRGSDLAAGIRLRVLAAGASGDDPRTVAILEVRAAGSRPTLAVVEGDASLVVAGLRVRPIASR